MMKEFEELSLATYVHTYIGSLIRMTAATDDPGLVGLILIIIIIRVIQDSSILATYLRTYCLPTYSTGIYTNGKPV